MNVGRERIRRILELSLFPHYLFLAAEISEKRIRKGFVKVSNDYIRERKKSFVAYPLKEFQTEE